MAAWNALYFTPGRFAPDPSQSAEWNRGAYLVEGAGHCGACHTPKTQLGGDETSARLPGLRPARLVRAEHHQRHDERAWFLEPRRHRQLSRTGHNATSAATGIMGEEVAMSTSQFNDADLRAVAVYLKDLPGPAPTGRAGGVRSADGRRRRDLQGRLRRLPRYDGKGVAMLFPALAGSPNVRSADPATLIRVLLEGAESVATDAEPTGPVMPSFSWRLDDAQAAAVLTYRDPQRLGLLCGAGRRSGRQVRHTPIPGGAESRVNSEGELSPERCAVCDRRGCVSGRQWRNSSALRRHRVARRVCGGGDDAGGRRSRRLWGRAIAVHDGRGFRDRTTHPVQP